MTSPYTPLYITNSASGLVRNRDNFIIPEDAFVDIENFYIFRGRILQKQFYSLLGRLRRDVTSLSQDVTDGTANYVDADLLDSVRATEPNAEMIPGTIVITIDAGNPDETIYEDSVTPGILTYISGTYTGSGTINYATGAVTITFTVVPPNGLTVDADLSYYPGLPVMGLPTYELPAINSEDLIGFDTKYAYRYSNTLNRWEEWIPGTTWASTLPNADNNFFWNYNYWQDASNRSLLWTTNFNGTTGDPTRYSNSITWTNFTPLITATETVWQCLAIVPFKDRLLFFNTYEGTTGLGLGGSTNFPQRCRFSQNGDPLAVDAWRQDIPGKGGFIDAPTNEIITGVAFIRDILVVYFERSTWQLRYTGNEILPFVFEKINSELGVEGTFSIVQFDRGVFGVGNYAITTCNGNAVERIDLQIPDEVFEFHNDENGPKRVYGIRDFTNELVYWTFPNDDENGKFPNRVLVYNYRNPAYSIFRDCFTCFGRYQRTNDIRWQDIQAMWQQLSGDEDTWTGGWLQSGYPIICSGNQQGFTFLLNQAANSGNGASLHITALTTGNQTTITSPDHTLIAGDFIQIDGIIGTASILNGGRYKIQSVTSNTIVINTIGTSLGLTYLGGGTLTRLDKIFLGSKRFNFLEQGMRKKIGYIDFLSQVTSSGEFTLQMYIDQNDSLAVNDGTDTFFNTIVPTFQEAEQTQGQELAWHRSFCFTEGQFLQFVITASDVQILDSDINSVPVNIHALILWQQVGGRLIQ